MSNIKKFLFLLSSHERKRAGLLIVMMLIMAVLDMIGIASILPFIAVLTNPEIVETNFILRNLYIFLERFGVVSSKQFVFVLGLIVFFTLLISIIFKAFTTYAQVRYVLMREYSITKRLLEGYLQQPYSWFLNRNSSELGKNILSEVGQVIGFGMRPMIELIAKSMVVIAFISLLIVVDPKLAFIVSTSLGGAYVAVFYFIRKFLSRIGNLRMQNNELRFRIISEAFSGIKPIKIGRLEEIYINQFRDSGFTYAKVQAQSQVINLLPRYMLEAVAFGGILLIVLFSLKNSGDFNDVLPIVSLYVIAGYRLMPALQQIYAACTSIAFLSPSLNKIYEDLNNIGSKENYENQVQNLIYPKKLISLKNIHFSYPNVSRKAIKNLNLDIPAKSTVGIVGATGSGKTTIVDIILGLLQAQKGTLEIDGKIITNQNLRFWQHSIGYVTQEIYLTDDTLERNIAFGINANNLDKDLVLKSAKKANLHDFIINELPQKYQTIVGERGVRLSGGQKQRIGIARALYRNPKVLVLDEATSALDNQTEKVVMEAVNNLSKDITIIIIAHRLSTLKNCDKIFLLENGQLKNTGTFEELIKNDDNFHKNSNN